MQLKIEKPLKLERNHFFLVFLQFFGLQLWEFTTFLGLSPPFYHTTSIHDKNRQTWIEKYYFDFFLWIFPMFFFHTYWMNFLFIFCVIYCVSVFVFSRHHLFSVGRSSSSRLSVETKRTIKLNVFSFHQKKKNENRMNLKPSIKINNLKKLSKTSTYTQKIFKPKISLKMHKKIITRSCKF